MPVVWHVHQGGLHTLAGDSLRWRQKLSDPPQRGRGADACGTASLTPFRIGWQRHPAERMLTAVAHPCRGQDTPFGVWWVAEKRRDIACCWCVRRAGCDARFTRRRLGTLCGGSAR